MKVENLDNYVLKITEKYMRYYYSSEAQIIKNVSTEYEISKGLEIPTSVSPITVSDYYILNDEIHGIYVTYVNKNDDTETVEIDFNSPITIELAEGNNDISRVSICTLELVENRVENK